MAENLKLGQYALDFCAFFTQSTYMNG